MNLSFPIYVQVRREQGEQVHDCRPLFQAEPGASDPHLGLAMSKLGRRMKQQFDVAGGRLDHRELADLAFDPPLESELVKLVLDLDDRLVRARFLFVTLESLGRSVAFSPSLPELWFDIERGQSLEARATEVFTDFFRREAKTARKHGGYAIDPAELAVPGQAWVTSLDLDITLNQKADDLSLLKLLSLIQQGQMNGGQELARVGRCLDWLYPDSLHRPIERDREIDQLDRLLHAPDLRPIALVGPRLAGKTAVLHGCVRKRVARRKKTYAAKDNVWLLSPQRLISGMMYVGQWEGRVEAILRAARKRRHILYFDDFLGLYRAGISRDSNLSVAEVLKPAILRREVRVLAEMSPEAWHKFQEHDRGLADQFHVLRIDALGQEATRRVLMDVQRQLEAEERCKFELDALPAILQLHASFVRDAEFPGKAAAFARQVARKHARQAIGRREVFEEFHHKTGIAMELLDDAERLERRHVVRWLGQRVIGQEAAVGAAADVVTVAKARLADPQRPLGVFLFLGPTGVGKTQCAKALAEVMYSDANRLLRFDMNQYVSSSAVAQLVGTFGEPEGLLTSAVRQQPFSVLLLDEIEKAHPDVFDLLLQVTGEGRLTDALGRTADFTNTVIVMTSNLGTSASTPIGLGAGDSGTQAHQFVRAAEQFFRPEFVNRIDRIIPFGPLSRDQMRSVARLVLENVLQRDGLVRRRCALAIEDAALERIVDAGYHPQFGARALKRAIERQLVQPVAAALAGVRPELPAVIQVLPRPEGVASILHSLESVPPIAASTIAEQSPPEQLARIQCFVARAQEEIDERRPHGSGKLGAEEVRYYALREHFHRVRDLARTAAEGWRAQERLPGQPQIAPKQAGSVKTGIQAGNYRAVPAKRFLRDIQAADDIHDYLAEVAVAAPRPGELEQLLTAIQHESSMLESMLRSLDDPEEAVLLFRPLVPAARLFTLQWSHRLRGVLAGLSYRAESISLSPAALESQEAHFALHVAGPGIWPLVAAERGTHVWAQKHDALAPVQVVVLPHASGDPRGTALAECDRRNSWLARCAAGAADPHSDPWPIGPIVRIHEEHGPTLDLRSGISLPALQGFDAWQKVLLAGLPRPAEFDEETRS